MVYLTLVYLEGGDVRLVSRTRHQYAQFDTLRRRLVTELLADDAIVDGEIVTLDDNGRPVFDDLMKDRDTRR